MIAKERAKAALKAAQTGDKRKAEESNPSGEPSVDSNDEEKEVGSEPSKKKHKKKEGKRHKDKKSKKFAK